MAKKNKLPLKNPTNECLGGGSIVVVPDDIVKKPVYMPPLTKRNAPAFIRNLRAKLPKSGVYDTLLRVDGSLTVECTNVPAALGRTEAVRELLQLVAKAVGPGYEVTVASVEHTAVRVVANAKPAPQLPLFVIETSQTATLHYSFEIRAKTAEEAKAIVLSGDCIGDLIDTNNYGEEHITSCKEA